MMSAWILYGIAIAALLTAAAHALEHLSRTYGWATRWAWAAAMVAALLIPLVAVNSPDENRTQRSPTAQAPTYVRSDVIAIEPPGNLNSRAIAASVSAATQQWLPRAWLAASVTLMLLFAAGHWRLHRRASEWQWRKILGVDVMVTRDTGPAVSGFLRPRIVIPAWLLDADTDTQRAVIAHESEHLRARDPQLLLLMSLIVALLPWNLPLWHCWRRLRFAIEVDCDARVLRSGHTAANYGEALLTVASRRSGVALLLTATGSARSLEKRIGLLFASPGRWRRSVAATTFLSALALTATAAQVTPPQRSAFIAAKEQLSKARQHATDSRLFNAAKLGDYDTAVALIAAGADVNEVIQGDGTPAIAAARRGDLRLLQLLIEKGASPDLACRGDGNPLIMAAARGHLDVARFLIEHGADINAIVIGDETPLISAVRNGNFSMVEFLVERGADTRLAVKADRTPSAETRSPVGEASKMGYDDIAEYLRAHGGA